MRLSRLLLELDDSINIVFVTGNDNYAVQAFDISALDYLMKPVTDQRLSKTLDKIRKRHRSAAASSSMEVVQDRKLNVNNRVQALQRAKQLNIFG